MLLLHRENMLALYQYLRRNKLHGVPKPTWRTNAVHPRFSLSLSIGSYSLVDTYYALLGRVAVDTRLRKVLLELPFLVEVLRQKTWLSG